MKNIEDILNNLSEEEKEHHKEIIQECLQRESLLIEKRQQIEENSEKLVAITQKIVSDVETFHRIFLKINNVTKALKNRTDSQNLLHIPDDKFFHG